MISLKESWLWVLAIVVGGCTTATQIQRKVETFDVRLSVVTDTDKPLNGAEIFVDYETVGKTKKDGLIQLNSIQLPLGNKVKVDSRCPEGYYNEGTQLTLFARRQASTPKGENQTLNGTVVCTATHRLVVLSVKVGNLLSKEDNESQPWFGLPVMVNNQKLAMTNNEGTALLAMKVKSNTEFDVTLDTSSFPTLEPQNPSANFVVSDRDTTLGFKQEFELPEVIKSPAPKKKQKKKKKKSKKKKQATGPIKMRSVRSR